MTEGLICRICFEGEEGGSFISPCKCTGKCVGRLSEVRPSPLSAHLARHQPRLQHYLSSVQVCLSVQGNRLFGTGTETVLWEQAFGLYSHWGWTAVSHSADTVSAESGSRHFHQLPCAWLQAESQQSEYQLETRRHQTHGTPPNSRTPPRPDFDGFRRYIRGRFRRGESPTRQIFPL